MNSKVSIIVPIYKTEPYLRKCVDSILSQTYRDLEIILVDDGSPDNSGAICDEYAAKDGRVRVIHKKNGGLSDARNAGMRIMTGAYVGFVDSDDWIEPGMYETLLDLMNRYEADMAFGGVADDVERGGTVTTEKTSDYGQTPFAEDKVSAMRRYFHGSWAAWDKLYRAELFRGIEYPVGEINEDEAIVLHLLDRCRRVCYTNEVFYHYMRREGSNTITMSAFSVRKMAWPKHCIANLSLIQEKYPNLVKDAALRCRGSVMWALREIALSDERFSSEITYLRNVLYDKKELFDKSEFANNQEQLTYKMLCSLPFAVYKFLLRRKYKRFLNRSRS